MNWIRDSLRVIVIVSLVSATTGYVWVKVQISDTARAMSAARDLSETLREERSKLQAAVDLAQRPGIVRGRAARELGLVDPAGYSQLYVPGVTP